MKRRLVWVLGAVCLVLAAVTVYLSLGKNYQPALAFVGDIAACKQVTSLDELGETQSVFLDGKTYRAVSLQAAIDSVRADGKLQEVFLISGDGFCVRLDGKSLGDSYLAFTQEDGWRAVNPAHPISANACQLEKVVVVATTDTVSLALTVITPQETAKKTVGALYAGETTEYPYYEGQAEKETGGVAFTSTIYTRRTCVTLDALGVARGERQLLFTADGESILTDGDALFQIDGNRLDYLAPEKRTTLADIRLICVDPPKAALSDLYYHARHYTEAKTAVKIVFARGLSEKAYQDGLKRGILTYLSAHFRATEAYGAYPITEEAWREAVLGGMKQANQTNMPLDAPTEDLDFTAETFDSQVKAICEGFGGMVMIAPLPDFDGNDESFYTVYLIENE